MKNISKIAAVACVLLMTITAFQNVSGKDINRDQWDYVIDDLGWWTHGVYVMPYRTNSSLQMNHEIFYVNNIEGSWSEPIRISDSPQKSSYPQIDIDSELGITYITWLEEGPRNRSLWYAGSLNGQDWSIPHQTSEIVNTIGNPSIEMIAEEGILQLDWRQNGNTIITADLDFDLIPDGKDSRPLDFDINIGVSFDADVITFNWDAGVFVAIDYVNNISIEPTISISTTLSVNGSIGSYVEITSSTNESFSAIIKMEYNPITLDQSITERYLRMYWQSNNTWQIMLNETTNENTGIDLENKYVWASTNHFTNFTAIDATFIDSDNDTISDAKEINIDNAPPALQISSFLDGNSTTTINCQDGQISTVEIGIPVSSVATTIVTNATFSIAHNFASFNEIQVTPDVNQGIYYLAPEIYRDKIVYRSNKVGNEDIYLYNLTSNIEIKISQNIDYNTMPKIWGENVVWLSRSMGMQYNILLYNITTGNVSTIGWGCYAPDISGNYVIWGGIYGGVYLYNISSGNTDTITGGYYGTPHVYGDYVAFNNYVTDGLILYQISTGTSRIINEPGSDPFLIDVGERHVVYQDLITYDLYAFEISQNVTTRITTTPGIIENTPNIFSNIVAWTDYRNGNADIYAYNLDSNQMFPICTAPSDQSYPSVYLDKIVWQDTRDGVSRIYMAKPTNTTVNFFIDETDVPFWNAQGTFGNPGSPDFSANLNKYLRDHNDSEDGVKDNRITIPISLIPNKNGTINLSNLIVNVSNYVTNPLCSDTDKDGVSDENEILSLSNPIEINAIPFLPYRLMSIYSDRFETIIKYPTETEYTQSSDIIDTTNVYGSNKIIEPATGCPKYVIKSSSLRLNFVIYSGTIVGVKLMPISQSTYYYFPATQVTTTFSGNDALGRAIKKCYITVSSTIPDGLYDFFISISGTPTSWAPHSVIILNSFKSISSSSCLKIIQVTDVHIGETGDNGNVRDFRAIIKAINRENPKPDFIIITGDLTDEGKLNEYKYFKACLYECNIPVFLSPGNHDWRNSGIVNYDSYLVPNRESSTQSTIRDYYFKYGSIGFIQFDSREDNGYPGYQLKGLTNDQFNWIKQSYIDLGYISTFVFTHGAFVDHSHWWGKSDTHLQNDLNYVNWANGRNIKATISGHTHAMHIFYTVTSSNIDNPPDKSNADAYYSLSSNYPFYLEMWSSTKHQ